MGYFHMHIKSDLTILIKHESSFFCSLEFLLFKFNMYNTYLNTFNIKYNLQMANKFH